MAKIKYYETDLVRLQSIADTTTNKKDKETILQAITELLGFNDVLVSMTKEDINNNIGVGET